MWPIKEHLSFGCRSGSNLGDNHRVACGIERVGNIIGDEAGAVLDFEGSRELAHGHASQTGLQIREDLPGDWANSLETRNVLAKRSGPPSVAWQIPIGPG